MKYRIKQLFLLLGSILLTIIYCIGCLLFWFVLVMGAFFWNTKNFNKMIEHAWRHVPTMETSIEDNSDYDSTL